MLSGGATKIMSNTRQTELFPTIVRVHKGTGTCTVEVPDLNVTIVGDGYTQAIGRAIETITALCVYRRERNIPIRINETFDTCAERTKGEKGKHFIYMLEPVYT